MRYRRSPLAGRRGHSRHRQRSIPSLMYAHKHSVASAPISPLLMFTDKSSPRSSRYRWWHSARDWRHSRGSSANCIPPCDPWPSETLIAAKVQHGTARMRKKIDGGQYCALRYGQRPSLGRGMGSFHYPATIRRPMRLSSMVKTTGAARAATPAERFNACVASTG